jgi:transposase-like protein
MKQSGTKLLEFEKDQILQASYQPECVISELAKQHGINPKNIYNWRKKKRMEALEASSKKSTTDFLELSVNDPSKKVASLKRAVLEFNNLSISIDGNIKSSALVQIINILEEPC